jgi:prepilin-type N-terminal cleavage/methylation domain-containing protein
MQSPQPQASGFSLIELSIVMAIMSAMATAIVPGMISQQREKLVEATAATYYALGDAAVAYYIDNDSWPGFMDADNTCQVDGLGQSGLQVLQNEGYISSASAHNPWQDGSVGQTFTLNAEGVDCDATGCASCALKIESGNIPQSAHNALANLLPLAHCAGESCTMQMSPEAGGVAGAELPGGAVMMFNDLCPLGWSEVTEMAGRMPVATGDPGIGSGLTPYGLGQKGGSIGFTLQGSATMGTRGHVTRNDPYGVVEKTRATVAGTPASAFDQLNLKARQWKETAFGDYFADTQVDSDANNTCPLAGECPDGLKSGWLKGAYTNGAPSAIETNLLETIPPYYAMSFCQKD